MLLAFLLVIADSIFKLLKTKNMITANELRIGNWIHEFNLPTQIDSRMLQKIESANERGKIIIDLSPIPITQEVLERCGFKKVPNTNEYFNEGKYPITLYMSNNRVSTSFWIGNEKRYLHQLQNLYFALTGEELQYTP